MIAPGILKLKTASPVAWCEPCLQPSTKKKQLEVTEHPEEKSKSCGRRKFPRHRAPPPRVTNVFEKSAIERDIALTPSFKPMSRRGFDLVTPGVDMGC